MNILFTICARAGSKGVKSKNARDFCGYPILYSTLSAFDLFAKRYAAGDDLTLAINTDSDVVIDQASKTTVPHIIVRREESLAGDFAPKISVIADTLNKAESMLGKSFDCVVDMDLTSPLRKVEDIHNIIEAAFSNPSCDLALSVANARRNPYFNLFALGDDGLIHVAIPSNYVARQQAPRVFDANASLYAYKPHYLKNNDGVILHANIAYAVMKDTAVLDIDSEEDYEMMGIIGEYFYSHDEALAEVHEHIPEILA